MLKGPDPDYGDSKDPCDITLADFLQYPIWVSALEEEGLEGRDETWMKPIINTTEVTAAALDLTATITLRIIGTDNYAVAEYDLDEKGLTGISICQDDEWCLLWSVTGLTFPLTLETLATIDGKEGVQFLCESPESDIAHRLD